MDAHFREYLGAVAAMQECYGERSDDHPSEFHEPGEGRNIGTTSRSDLVAGQAA